MALGCNSSFRPAFRRDPVTRALGNVTELNSGARDGDDVCRIDVSGNGVAESRYAAGAMAHWYRTCLYC